MSKIPEIIPLTDLRQEAAGVIKRLQKRCSHGHHAARPCCSRAHQHGWVRTTNPKPELLNLLIQGEKEISVETGYALEDVMAEAERLLTDDAD